MIRRVLFHIRLDHLELKRGVEAIEVTIDIGNIGRVGLLKHPSEKVIDLVPRSRLHDAAAEAEQGTSDLFALALVL